MKIQIFIHLQVEIQYKVPYKKLSYKSNTFVKYKSSYITKNNMNRVIQKDGKLYYLLVHFG